MLKKEIFGKVKKALALTLTSAMIATLCSNFVGVLKVEAAPRSDIGLGVSLIKNPAGSGDWNKLYFGSYQRRGAKYRLVWRVLNVSNTDLFLDCNNVIEGVFNYSDSDPNTYEWKYSQIHNWLNSDTGFIKSENFTPEELNCIYGFKIDEQTSTGFTASVDMEVDNDKFFLLGANDVRSRNYGYDSDASRKKTSIYGSVDDVTGWWLRTRNVNTYTIHNENGKNYTGIQFIGGLQKINGNDYAGKFAPWVDQMYHGYTGVSPACDINSRTILFTRAIKDIGYKEFALTLLGSGEINHS